MEEPTSIAFLESSVLFLSSMHVCIHIYVYAHTVIVLLGQGGSNTERMAGSNLESKMHSKIMNRSD